MTVGREHANDDPLIPVMEAEAAKHGGEVSIERVVGQWRAGFVLRDDPGT